MSESSIGSRGVAKVLLSRFNLYIPKFREMAGLDDQGYEDWCRRRVALFRNYTLPSVLGQQPGHPFKWLIYFDTETNASIDDLLSELRNHDFIHCIQFDLRGKSAVQPFTDQIQLDIDRIVHPTARYFATTRLDTDDALGRHFFANLDHHLHRMKLTDYPGDVAAITFPFGSQIMGDVINAYIYDRNPFITLVEKHPMHGAEQPIRSVFSVAHYDVERIAVLYRALTTTPQWLQVIHGGNAANEFKHDLPRLDGDQIADWFSLSR